MVFDPQLRPGDEIDNDQLREIFQCSSQGGMRRSTRTNTLVLVSSHIDSIYNDRWVGKILHYTGMGTKGDQSLDFMQNKTLAESRSLGVDIHLFEVNQPQTYTYVGSVQLDGEPYKEDQPDRDGVNRKVWIFPLKPISGHTPVIGAEEFERQQERAREQARRLTDEDIRRRAAKARPVPGQREILGIRYERDPYVAENAKRRARGVCDLCGTEAPFANPKGDPYLETHHIRWLSEGGADSEENTVALCPNCHRRMHVLDLEEDKVKLRDKARLSGR